MANQQQPPSSSSSAADACYGDASDLLAEALKQMDGLLGDTTKPSAPLVQNGHHSGTPPHHRGRLSNGGGGGGSTFVNSSSIAKMSPKLQTSRAVWLFNDLYTALKSLENPSVIFQQLQTETQEYFVKWLSNSSQVKDQPPPIGPPDPAPHKLDLMAENSSLKVRLARLEKDLQDSVEKFNTAQLRINELQSRLNDRTIEVTELRGRVACSAPSSPDRSISNSFKDKTIERERTLDRLKRKHYEVEKLKQAVESLMATNEEKNLRIEELRSIVKRYKRMEEMLVKMQGAKVLEQIGIDGDNISNGSSARNSSGSCNDNSHTVETRVNVDGMEPYDQREILVSGIPNPTATSTPVNNRSISDSPCISSSLKRNPQLIGSFPLAIDQSVSSNPMRTDVRSNSYDDIISAPSKTPPATVKRRADVYGTLPKDYYTSEFQMVPSSGYSTPSNPSTPYTSSIQRRPPLPPHATSTTGHPAVQSSTVPRKQRAFMSFGKGFLRMRRGQWSRSAPMLAKTDAEEETLKDEMAQQYKALQSQVHTEQLKKKNSAKGLKKFFVKIKRSNSQSLDDKLEDFKRSGLRSTAGPRLGWSKELNDLELPFGRWDTDRVALWLHVMGLSTYVGECKRWVKNGEHLLRATSHDLEKELGIRNHFHRKKLQLALQAISSDARSPVSELDHTWVTRWLDDIGLPQYKDQFTEARIDGRMLHYLTVDDLIGLKVTNQLHHLSLRRGIQVLRMNNFSPSCLKRRPVPDEGVLHNCPHEVVLWTNHRVMEWLRNIDLSEYAPNLRGSGVHGALMVLEPRFGAELFATILSIPSNKTLLRRHLSTHFVALIGSLVQQQKRELEAQAGYAPLTPSLRVKVKKSIFRNLKSDDKDDFVCPMDPRADRELCLNGGAKVADGIPKEEDEHLLARDHRYLDNVPTSDV